MRDTRNIEGEIRDENILAGSGCAHFSWWDSGYGWRDARFTDSK